MFASIELISGTVVWYSQRLQFGISLMVLDVVFEYGVISRSMVTSSANFGFKKKNILESIT